MKKALIVVIIVGMFCGFGFSADSVEKKELSLKDAIFHALKSNLDLQIQKTETEVSKLNWQIEKTIYLPTLESNVNYSKENQPSTNIYDGVKTIEQENFNWSIGVAQQIPFGGRFNVSFENRRSETNRKNSLFTPQIFTIGSISFTQPLLRNFGKLPTNYQIRINNNNMKISQHQLEQTIIDLVYNVESAYWELVYAHQNLEARRMALERSKDLLKQNEIKVKVGTAAPIEILSSKAEVASNESRVIQAEQTIQTREESLKRILNMSKEPFPIVPIDQPEIKESSLVFEKVLLEALENRPDIKRAKLNLQNNNITVKYNKNQALPTLDLVTQFVSYGIAGTEWVNTTIDPNDPNFQRIELEKRSFLDALKDVFKANNNYYQVSLRFEIPIPMTRQKTQLAIARVNMKRALMELKNAENTIYSEVKDVIKSLQSNRKLVEADKIALELQGENLKAEEKKLSVGLSTNFNVLQYQQQFADAQTQLLRSTIDYVLTLARTNQILNRTFKVYDINLK